MSYMNILPVELWLLILETTIALTLEPCSPVACPDLDSHLHLAWDYGPPCNKTFYDLRLVCRTFNALLRPSTSFHYIMEDLEMPIPPRSRAVYIKYSEYAGLRFQRLLTNPSICGQIITLALPGNQRGHYVQPGLFNALCENSRALCHLRNLTIGLEDAILNWTCQFWSGINSSFPRLICLVVRGHASDAVREDSVVVFKNLEVLDLEKTSLPSHIQFPALRHLAGNHIGQIDRGGVIGFAGWPSIESLLVRQGRYKWKMIWNELPYLRLLATTSEAILGFDPLPPHHPLQHIHIDVGPMNDHRFFHIRKDTRKQDELRFIAELGKIFPTIARVTLVLKTPKGARTKKGGKGGMVGDFDAGALALVGFTVNHFAGGPYWGGRRIVLERVRTITHENGV